MDANMALLVGESKPRSQVLCCSSMTSVRRDGSPYRVASPTVWTLELDGVNM